MDFRGLVEQFIGIIDVLVPVIFALTLVFIIWKMVTTWIMHGGDTTKIEEGKNTIVVGVIALVVMSSVWGIVAVLRNSLF